MNVKRRAAAAREVRCHAWDTPVIAVSCEDASTMDALPADPTVIHPLPEQPRVVLLKPLVKSPLIEVGEYSYAPRRPAGCAVGW
jgi:hypothetical protein